MIRGRFQTSKNGGGVTWDLLRTRLGLPEGGGPLHNLVWRYVATASPSGGIPEGQGLPPQFKDYCLRRSVYASA